MGLCKAAQVLVVSGGMHLCCSRLSSPLHCRASLPQLSPFFASSSTVHCLRGSVQRTQHFAPILRNQRGTRVSSTLKESSEDLKQEQQQLSTKANDSSASKGEGSTVVEHVIFFKVNDEMPSEDFLKEFRTLKSLDGIVGLSASKVLQILGADYTLVFHTRHVNKASLDAYAVHPSHVAFVKKFSPYIEDRLAVDWEAAPVGSPIEGGHGATRIALIKLADGLTEEETSVVLAFLSGLRDKFPFIRQISAGKNFAPARAKGFNVGFLALFDNVEELEQLNGNAELHAVMRNSKVAPLMSSFVIADIDSKDH